MTDKEQGLVHNKFYVQRTDNETNRKHDGCRYFVLDPQHDPIAFQTLAVYAVNARSEGFTQLAEDIATWLREIEEASR